jgi:flagellar FliJ protein
VAESRAKRLQIVLTLAERYEQDAAIQVREWRIQLSNEQEQLRQLEEYTEQYLQVYRTRTQSLYAEELMTYSGFIQRLSSARSEQELKLARVTQQYDMSLQEWRKRYQRRESIAEMINRLQREDNALLEKRLQKELDELTMQQYQRHNP